MDRATTLTLYWGKLLVSPVCGFAFVAFYTSVVCSIMGEILATFRFTPAGITLIVTVTMCVATAMSTLLCVMLASSLNEYEKHCTDVVTARGN